MLLQTQSLETQSGLSGAIILIFLFALVIGLPCAFVLVARYRSALIKGMGYDSDKFLNNSKDEIIENQTSKMHAAIEVVETKTLSKNSSPTYFKVSETLGWHWIIYGLMCLAFAWWCAHFYLISEGEISSLGFALQVIAFSFPFVPVSFLLLASSTKQRFILTGLFIMILIIAVTIVWGKNQNPDVGFTDILLPVIVYNLFPIALILTLRLKRIRAIGLFLFAFCVLALSGPILFFWYLGSNSKTLEFFGKALTGQGFSSGTTIFIFVIFPLILACTIGWYFIKWLKSLYERKQINDLQLTADSIVIIFNLIYSLYLIEKQPFEAILMLLAFPLYKALGYLFFFLLRKRRISKVSPRLLLLRVFALGDDADSLFQRILKHWRYAGSIQMISGPDLALSTLELHEMINYISGNLKKSFCEDTDSIQRNMDRLDNEPDLDATHRVNELFCRNNNWKEVLQQLVKKSEVVLIDLRSFSEKYKGCRFEIEALVNLFPMNRTVILVDKRTDLDFTRKVFDEAYSRATAYSVNVLHQIPVKLYVTSTATDDEVFRINNLMCGIAETAK